jgi:soluble cytochrome b562
MDRFYKISQDTINDFFKVFDKKSFPLPLKFEFLGDNKQKALIKISKIPDDIAFLLSKELKVTINEELIDVYDEESVQILIEQEIDKISMNLDSGKIKMIKTDLNTFSSLVNKYGLEKVSKANKVEELYQQQKDDSQSEFII